MNIFAALLNRFRRPKSELVSGECRYCGTTFSVDRRVLPRAPFCCPACFKKLRPTLPAAPLFPPPDANAADQLSEQIKRYMRGGK